LKEDRHCASAGVATVAVFGVVMIVGVIVAKLLTSRSHGHPKSPPAGHRLPRRRLHDGQHAECPSLVGGVFRAAEIKAIASGPRPTRRALPAPKKRWADFQE